MKEKFYISIEIICIKDDEISFDMSIDEAVQKIKEGYYSGMDGNEDEEYTFKLKKKDL